MPEPSPSSLDTLLEQCILALESGASVDDVLAANPDAAPALRERLDHLAALGILQAPKSSAAIPERLGEFRLLRQIGRGGMGIVYLAEQTALQRNVALKLVHPEQLFFGGARERFRREILAVARLQHTGIVPILTCGEAEGIPFYAMDLVHGASIGEVLAELTGTAPEALAGPSLRAALQRAMAKKKELEGVQDAAVFQGAWTNVCCRLALEAAEALQHAHDQGVLHRDLKPSNLLLTSAGQVRLIDFGLASARGEQRLTRSGATLGSLPYMAPEQVRGDLTQVDVRTDVYALGVTLYELLTLALPHGDGSGDTRERILAGHVEPPSRKNEFVHADADAICLKAMDPDPSRRYRTAAAFAEDLRAFLEHRTVAARRPSLLLRSRRWARRNPTRAATAIVAFMLLVPGPLVLAVQQNIAAGHLQNALHEVEEQRRLAQRHLEEAQVEQQRAEHNLDQALRAVDLMLLRTSEARLVHQPRTAALRKQLLQDAVAFHESLIASGGASPGDPRPREEHARSLSRLGALQCELGDLDKALRLLLDARAEIEAGLTTTPNAVAQKSELADTWDRLGTVYARMNRFDEAEDALRHNTEILDSLLEQAPTPRTLENTITARLTLAVSLQRRQRSDEALRILDELEKRLAGSDHVVALAPAAKIRLRSDIADNRGIVLARVGDTEGAMRAFLTSLETLDLLPADARDTPQIVAQRAGVLQRIGLVAHQRRDWETAMPYLDRACADYQRLLEDEPNLVRWPVNYARVLSTRAANLNLLGKVADAGPDHDRAIAVLEKAYAAAPRETQLPRALAIALAERGSHHQRMDSHTVALKDFERAIGLFTDAVASDPEDDLGRSNLAAALANQAESLRATGNLVRARESADRALEIIRTCPGPEAKRSLVELLSSASDLAMRAGDATTSLAMMEEATTIVDELLAQSPNDRARQITKGLLALNHGTARVNARQMPRALEIWAAAVPTLRAGAADSTQVREVLGVMLMRLADICDRMGEKERAFAWFDEAIATTGTNSEKLAAYPSLVDLFDREEFNSRLPVGHPDR